MSSDATMSSDVAMSGDVGVSDAAPMDGTTEICGNLVGPNVEAGCYCSGSDCLADGCYGGWWCNTSTNRCERPPSSCNGDP